VQAPEPSNILYENLGVSDGARSRLSCFTALVVLILILLSVGFNFAAEHYRSALTETDFVCPIDNPANYTHDRVVLYPDDLDILQCYCVSLGQEIWGQAVICKNYLGDFAMSQTIQNLAVVVIIMCNYILRTVSKSLALIERHRSVSAQQESMTIKLFYSLFLNTALVVVLVNANFSVPSYLSWFFFGTGQFVNATPAWYKTVGGSITFTFCLLVFNPHILPVFMSCFGRCYREHLIANFKPSNYKSQDELDKKFAGEDFIIADRYGNVLNVIFMTLFYGPAFPIFYPIAALCFIVTYVCEKYSFLRYYSNPPHYDAQLQERFVRTLPYGLFLHSISALYFYTSPVTDSYPLSRYTILGNSSGLDYIDDNFQGRLLQVNSFPSACFIALFVVWKVLFFIFRLCPCCDHANTALSASSLKSYQGLPDYWTAKREAVMESYHVHDDPTYANAYLKSDSDKQLKPMTELMPDPYKNQLGSIKESAGQAYFNRAMRQSAAHTLAGKSKKATDSSSGSDSESITGGESDSTIDASSSDSDGGLPVGRVAAFKCASEGCRKTFQIKLADGPMQYQCPFCGTIMQIE